MFPDRVYYCDCIKIDVQMCLVNGDYSLKDIIKKLRKCKVNKVFFCVKCGEDKRYVIFSCRSHMKLRTFLTGNDYSLEHKRVCKKCIKEYLRIAYSCCYDHVKFDVPKDVKRLKKTLRLKL